jgi:3-isopropylmalate dehydratase
MAKNGMLAGIIPDPVQLEKVAEEARQGREIEVDLPTQEVRASDGQLLARFDIDGFRKQCLVNGWDDISLTMQLDGAIERFENRRKTNWPWLEGKAYLKKDAYGALKIEGKPVPRANVGLANPPPEW